MEIFLNYTPGATVALGSTEAALTSVQKSGKFTLCWCAGSRERLQMRILEPQRASLHSEPAVHDLQET